MAKVLWKPGTMIYPVPAVMVSCGTKPEDYNIITIAWTGTLCTNPPMCYISIRPERLSYDIIKQSGEFVINLTNKELAYATDWCGLKSGRDVNKFAEMKLTPEAGSRVTAPLIRESPLNIECVVREIKPLGSHDMFIAEVVAVHCDDKYIDPKTDSLDMSKVRPIAYSHGFYYLLGDSLGKFGFSVKRKDALSRAK